jgi:hypothetical protein
MKRCRQPWVGDVHHAPNPIAESLARSLKCIEAPGIALNGPLRAVHAVGWRQDWSMIENVDGAGAWHARYGHRMLGSERFVAQSLRFTAASNL